MVKISKIKHILILLVVFPVVFYFFDLYKDNLLASEHQFLPYLLSSTIGLMIALLFEQFVLQRLGRFHYFFKIVVIMVGAIGFLVLFSELGIEKFSLINLTSIHVSFLAGCILLMLEKQQSSTA
ncbi:MAG: hypothetical protein HRU22_18545 [Gammaproteobacteria bacterium]|nr:hypothetical protein [Gammaproteobacteria bacterium]